MFTRLYSLFLLVSLPWLWFDTSNDYELRAKIVWSGVLLGGYAVAMWLESIRAMGLRSMRMVPLLTRIFFLSKRGTVLSAILVLSLLYFWSPVAENPSPFRLEISVSLIMVIFLLWTQPPYLLFLAGSNPKAGHALQKIATQLLPHRTIALLDHRRTGSYLGGFSLFTDDLRTASQYEWRSLVDELSDLVPRIVLDARTESQAVIDEVELILEHSDRREKAIFIVEENGPSPALLPYLDNPYLDRIPKITEAKLDSAIDRLILQQGVR